MSLPAAPKQTTEKPAPGSVIEPVNKDDQAADIDRKVCSNPPFVRRPWFNLTFVSSYDYTA